METNDPQQQQSIGQLARIKVAGVGGAGGNAIQYMIAAGLRHVDFVAMNTDAQALTRVPSARHVHLGERITRGLGAGGDPAMGARAAEESAEIIAATLAGADLVFVTLGLGGGTGTGAGPIVARIARKQGALVVGVVTLPFGFEGRKRAASAWRGLLAMREQVDTLVTIPNDRLFGATAANVTLLDAFRVADDVLRQAVGGLTDLVTVPGLINLDFADLRAVMAGAGTALMSVGEADGPKRASVAAHLALTNPLLGLEVQGAQGIVFNVTGGSDMTLAEVQLVAEIIGNAGHPDATMIFGAVNDDAYAGRLRVTVVATGFAAALTALTPPKGLLASPPAPAMADPTPSVTRTPTTPLPEMPLTATQPPPVPATTPGRYWEPAPTPAAPVRAISPPQPDLVPSGASATRDARNQSTSALPAYLRRHWK